MKHRKWFEDFEQGFVFEYSLPGLTVKEITEFATLYDPQRFHLDEAEAKKTHFGGLVASGFHTQILCFRHFCKNVLLGSEALGAPGIDTIKWLRPWYPGESLDVRVSMVGKRRSAKRADRGYLSFQLQADVDGAATMEMAWANIILVREGASKLA